MIRKIISIDKEKCNGCGACANACHEGAIGMVNGKAELLRDDYCDGLGDCLPACPVNAISFVEREAAAYDEEAVKKNMAAKAAAAHGGHSGCPGHRAMKIERKPQQPTESKVDFNSSELRQWPCQIRLAAVNAEFFDDAELLIAADCTAYAYADIHRDFMRGKVTLIGCPKLDDTDYSEKLTEILKSHNIKSVTVVRMEVPCCGGIENAVRQALQNCGKLIPWQTVTVSIDGKILNKSF